MADTGDIEAIAGHRAQDGANPSQRERSRQFGVQPESAGNK